MSIIEPVEHSDAKDYGVSVVRTVTLPAVVAIGTSWALNEFDVDLSSWEPVISIAVGYVAYAVVRFLEVFSSPKWGYILGLPKAPAYPGN